MLQFACRAHLGEYVIDAEDPGTFAATDGTLTHTREGTDSTVSVPVADIRTISFERNTTLHRNRFLGVFFGILSLLLVGLLYALVVLGDVETLNEAATALFVLLLAIGGLSTAAGYLRHTNRDVIDVYIETSDERLVVCGRMDDVEFVDSCRTLVDSDLPTTVRHSRIESALN